MDQQDGRELRRTHPPKAQKRNTLPLPPGLHHTLEMAAKTNRGEMVGGENDLASGLRPATPGIPLPANHIPTCQPRHWRWALQPFTWLCLSRSLIYLEGTCLGCPGLPWPWHRCSVGPIASLSHNDLPRRDIRRYECVHHQRAADHPRIVPDIIFPPTSEFFSPGYSIGAHGLRALRMDRAPPWHGMTRHT